MATLGIRQTTWQALSDRDKEVFRYVGDVLKLGEPAKYRDGSNNVWFVFDDHRFTPKHIAYLGCLAANVGDFPAAYEIPEDKSQLRQDIKTFCDNHGVVLPKDVNFPDDDRNPWQTLLDAQGTPASMQMASGVPTSWTPVVVEP